MPPPPPNFRQSRREPFQGGKDALGKVAVALVLEVGIAGGVAHAEAAADVMAQEGVSVEVIDPRTLVPLDKNTVLKSVEKTGRLVIVDPAHKVCSAASEIASIVAEEGFWSLQAPIMKVATEQVNVPYSPALEPLIYPTPEKVVTAIRKTLG